MPGYEREDRIALHKKQDNVDDVANLIKSDSKITRIKIKEVLDKLDGADFLGNDIQTSSTPTVDELEDCVGILAGRVNLIIKALRRVGIID
tara:strand:+ start:2231 stop:2503 length:273 start_codon:yes stop_codon:yes gene_type:complete